MPREYAVDLRERLLAAQDAGLAATEIERTFGVPRRTLRRWRQWQRERAVLTDQPRSGRPRAIPADQMEVLRAQVAAHPDATLAEHCWQWQAEHGVRPSEATMCRRLQELGLPLKQRPGSRANAMTPNGPPGGRRSATATRPTSSSSTRRARRSP